MRVNHVLLKPLAAGLLAGAILAGCGTAAGPGGGNGSIAISVSKTSLSITQGQSDNLTASITRAGGFTGDVVITTTGAPAGVTATASNVTTSGGTTTGTITVAVAETAAPGGPTSLTVTASGSGVTSVQQVIALTINPKPAIALTLTGSPISVQSGTSGTIQVTIGRTNFTGPVTLALEGAPASGVTGTFAPNPATGGTSVLTLAVAAGVTPGALPAMTVRATGQGVIAVTAPVTITVTAPPSGFTLSVAPTISVGRRQSGNTTVTITRTNFTADVALSVTGLPTDVTAGFDVASAPGASPGQTPGNSSVLTLTVGAGAPLGDVNLVVKGNSQGQPESMAPLKLTVTETGDFTLTATPNSVSFQTGGNTNTTINVVRTGGFPGSVALTATPPVGVAITATLNPTSTTGNSSNLAISSTAPVGSYPVVIKGNAPGLADQMTTVVVNITTGSGGEGNVSLDYTGCAVEDKPIWVAYQDGTGGTWTRVNPTNTNFFIFNINEPKGAYAEVRQNGTGFKTSVTYWSKAQLTGLTGHPFCPPPLAARTATGSAVNLGPTQTATIGFGGAFAVASFAGPNFNLSRIGPGTHDLVAYAKDLLGAGGGDRGVIIPALNPVNGGSVGNVDFTGSFSFTPATSTITVNGVGTGETVTQAMNYLTGPACSSGGTLGSPGQVTAGSFTAYGVPSDRQPADGGLHTLTLSGTFPLLGTRSVTESFTTLGARTVALPPALAAPTVSLLAGPYKRLRFQYTLPSEYNGITIVAISDAVPAAPPSFRAMRAQLQDDAKGISLFATPEYLGGLVVDLSVPDFSSVNGWTNIWAPASSAVVVAPLFATGANSLGTCANNGRAVFASRVF